MISCSKLQERPSKHKIVVIHGLSQQADAAAKERVDDLIRQKGTSNVDLTVVSFNDSQVPVYDGLGEYKSLDATKIASCKRLYSCFVATKTGCFNRSADPLIQALEQANDVFVPVEISSLAPYSFHGQPQLLQVFERALSMLKRNTIFDSQGIPFHPRRNLPGYDQFMHVIGFDNGNQQTEVNLAKAQFSWLAKVWGYSNVSFADFSDSQEKSEPVLPIEIKLPKASDLNDQKVLFIKGSSRKKSFSAELARNLMAGYGLTNNQIIEFDPAINNPEVLTTALASADVVFWSFGLIYGNLPGQLLEAIKNVQVAKQGQKHVGGYSRGVSRCRS